MLQTIFYTYTYLTERGKEGERERGREGERETHETSGQSRLNDGVKMSFADSNVDIVSALPARPPGASTATNTILNADSAAAPAEHTALNAHALNPDALNAAATTATKQPYCNNALYPATPQPHTLYAARRRRSTCAATPASHTRVCGTRADADDGAHAAGNGDDTSRRNCRQTLRRGPLDPAARRCSSFSCFPHTACGPSSGLPRPAPTGSSTQFPPSDRGVKWGRSWGRDGNGCSSRSASELGATDGREIRQNLLFESHDAHHFVGAAA